MNLTVRKAKRTDISKIITFNLAMAQETEDKQLDESVLTKGVTNVFEASNLGQYWVATLDNEVVGCLLITYEWSDWRNGLFWWIQSVYVQKEHRRKGIYAALYAHILQEARTSKEICGIRLYVEEKNQQAQLTYQALGMKHAGYWVFEEIF